MKRQTLLSVTAAALLLSTTAAALFPVTAQGQHHSHKEQVMTKAGPVTVEKLADGLNHPWGMAFLPDGRLLVSERAGPLRILKPDGTLSDPVAGVPKVQAQGQGGLQDVALDPNFASNNLVYLSYAEPRKGGAGTAVGRGKLENDRITGFEVIFRQEPAVEGDAHFGSRLVFAPDGKLFVTLGERFKFDPAQDLSGHLGKVVRINPDGSVPEDNPFVKQKDARAEIWSYGHRNIESAAIHPQTGELWIAEMGPMGGDELNRPEAGRNHGWPLVSWGDHYDGKKIPDPPTRPELADAVHYWTSGIAPSGMRFYTGDLFPAWKGSMLIGSLLTESVVRMRIDGQKATEEERIPLETRIRDVEQAPDGSVYVLTDDDNGKVLRIKPMQTKN